MTFQASAVLRAAGANLDQTERRACPEKQVHQDRTVALDCWDLTDLQDNPAYVANRVQQGPKDHVVQTVVAVSPGAPLSPSAPSAPISAAAAHAICPHVLTVMPDIMQRI